MIPDEQEFIRRQGWSDERIDEAALDAVVEVLRALRNSNGDPVAAGEPVAFRMRQVRDDLAAQLAAARQRIVELESAWWMPVEPPFIRQCFSFSGRQRTLGVDTSNELMIASTENSLTVALPDELRLCRRQGQEGVEG